MNTSSRWRFALTLLGALAAAPIALALPTTSVLDLYMRLPDPPSTVEEAMRWVDRSGTLVHPGLLALKRDIEAHRQAIDEIARARAPAQQAQAAAQVEDMGKGLADVGIDMARMQRDPAYAQEVRARLQKMSPQEQMAFAQRMARPMQQDARLVNQAKATADDSAPVRSAAEAGFEFSQQLMQRAEMHQRRAQEADAEVRQILARPLNPGLPKPAMEYDNPGCNPGCVAQWDAYAARLLPLMIARDTEVLKARRAAWQRERQDVAETIRSADKHLLAAQYGVGAQSQLNQARIGGYAAGSVDEVGQLVARIEGMAQRAVLVAHCGKQAVQVPAAVCR